MTLADGRRTPGGRRRRGGGVADDVTHLLHLIDVMHHHVPPGSADARELALMAGDVSASTAEQHLRAIGALLATLDTYLCGLRAGGRHRGGRATDVPARVAPAPPAETEHGPSGALAAAAARYIARDLAARHLSEFTSAEGYRLARTLARIGGIEAAVERLLADANTIRLHPPSLADAVSHSAG